MLKKSQIMISVQDLTFDYPGKRALNQTSFEIETNTITAVVGPNGAGKSTLFRCLAGLDTPTTGSIQLGDLNVLEFPREAHQQIGYLPDFYGLYEELTVKRCLQYHAMIQNVPSHRLEEVINNVAERLQITDQLQQDAGTLSRGQRQRLAIGQAIIHHPKVLLLDEPASGLDPEARQHLSELLVSLRQEGMTILVSSHILAELQDYCSHMLILREGKLVNHCAIEDTTSAGSKSMMDIYMGSKA